MKLLLTILVLAFGLTACADFAYNRGCNGSIEPACRNNPDR